MSDKHENNKLEGSNYQPNTQAVMLRSHLLLMKERYNWDYTMKTFQFPGGLPMVMTRLFQVRLKNDKSKTVSSSLITL